MVVRVRCVDDCGVTDTRGARRRARLLWAHQSQFAARARRVGAQHCRLCTSGVYPPSTTQGCARVGGGRVALKAKGSRYLLAGMMSQLGQRPQHHRQRLWPPQQPHETHGRVRLLTVESKIQKGIELKILLAAKLSRSRGSTSLLEQTTRPTRLQPSCRRLQHRVSVGALVRPHLRGEAVGIGQQAGVNAGKQVAGQWHLHERVRPQHRGYRLWRPPARVRVFAASSERASSHTAAP